VAPEVVVVTVPTANPAPVIVELADAAVNPPIFGTDAVLAGVVMLALAEEYAPIEVETAVTAVYAALVTVVSAPTRNW
jgi:hypothetical protein